MIILFDAFQCFNFGALMNLNGFLIWTILFFCFILDYCFNRPAVTAKITISIKQKLDEFLDIYGRFWKWT